MTCLRCQHGRAKRFGFYSKRKIQRWRCTSCSATFADPSTPRLGTHYIAPEIAAKVLTLMLEGMSIRAISRFTGLHKNTILSLMLTAARNANHALDARSATCARTTCNAMRFGASLERRRGKFAKRTLLKSEINGFLSHSTRKPSWCPVSRSASGQKKPHFAFCRI